MCSMNSCVVKGEPRPRRMLGAECSEERVLGLSFFLIQEQEDGSVGCTVLQSAVVSLWPQPLTLKVTATKKESNKSPKAKLTSSLSQMPP